MGTVIKINSWELGLVTRLIELIRFRYVELEYMIPFNFPMVS